MYRKILGKKHTGQKIYKCVWLGRLLSSRSRESEETCDIAQNHVGYQAGGGTEEKPNKKAEAPCVSPVNPYLKYLHIKNVFINTSTYIYTYEK